MPVLTSEHRRAVAHAIKWRRVWKGLSLQRVFEEEENLKASGFTVTWRQVAEGEGGSADDRTQAPKDTRSVSGWWQLNHASPHWSGVGGDDVRVTSPAGRGVAEVWPRYGPGWLETHSASYDDFKEMVLLFLYPNHLPLNI